MEEHPDRAYLIALANCPSFGARSLEKLSAHFGNAKATWEAPMDDFRELNFPEKRLAVFFAFRKSFAPETFLSVMEKHSIRSLAKDDAEYPPLLKTIFDPPFLLFLKGATLTTPAVAIVGSRKNTTYGQGVTFQFAKFLAESGVSIVSGLAEGTDSTAHKGALEAKGHTAAILGGGLLAINNMDHENLGERIVREGGTVVSEFALSSPYLRYHFPMRNRIIAGMSTITLIVEAGLPSGSLITAKSALESGRDVFAVPGPITSATSAGTNYLLREGAHVATSPDDILLALNMNTANISMMEKRVQKPLPPLTPSAKTIYDLLARQSLFADEITAQTAFSPQMVSQTLLELELLGVIRHLGATRYECVS